MRVPAKLVSSVKDFAFTVYGQVFNIGAKLPVKRRRIALFSLYDANFKDSLGEVEQELERRAPGKYDIIRVDREDLFKSKKSALKFMTVDALKMSRAKYIFMNNNFMAMGRMNPNKKTEVIQLWHGQGAFKKFGYDMPQPPEVRKLEVGANRNLTYVVCSSPYVAPFYMSAFGVTEDRIISTGTPNEDWYFDPKNTGSAAISAARAEFDKQYPEAAGKYLILYAPTFRDDPGAGSVLSHMDLSQLKAAAEEGLGREVCVMVRLHPHDPCAGKIDLEDGIMDMTSYPDINALCLLTDLMITDYSSVCMNFALLRRPMVFYAYDLDNYKDGRNFYFDFEEYVPGPVAKNMEELCAVMRSRDFRTDKLEAFRHTNFGEPDGTATKQLLDKIL